MREPPRNTRVFSCLEMAKKFAEKRDFAVKFHSAIFCRGFAKSDAFKQPDRGLQSVLKNRLSYESLNTEKF